MDINNIILWSAIALFCIFLILFFLGEHKTLKNLDYIHRTIAKSMLPTVSAGSHFVDIPSEKESVSIHFNSFKLYSGQCLNTNEYVAYLVQGNSMQFCDIHTGDIVFSKKNFNIDQLSDFPAIVILKNLKASENECRYKIRRAWKVCPNNLSTEDYKNILTEIMSSAEYRALKEKAHDIYNTDAEMLDGFMIKLNNYKNKDLSSNSIVISSTYDVDEKKIRFSIHNASSIIGTVSYVTSVDEINNRKAA